MEVIKTEASRLSSIWDMLNRPMGPPRARLVKQHISRFVARGWALPYQVEDLLVDLNCPLWGDRDIYGLLGVPRQTMFRRPKARSTGCLGFEYILAAEVAAMLIMIERIGFPIDPAPFVEAILPAIKRKPMLTPAEMSVFWFHRERHRMEPVEIVADFGPGLRSYRDVQLATGYTVEVIEQAGAVRSLTATAPRYRRRRCAA